MAKSNNRNKKAVKGVKGKAEQRLADRQSDYDRSLASNSGFTRPGSLKFRPN